MSTAIAPPAPPKLLTYEAYMAEETDYRRYDIVDGVKIVMPGATDNHQDIQLNIAVLFRAFEHQHRLGKARTAPRDVQISRVPLRTRQPDVFFVSNNRIALNPSPLDPTPMTAAPELVVEVISSSETASRFNDKIRDYCTVDVEECWKVMSDTQTVEVLRLSRSGATPVQTYGMGEIVQSITFNDLTVAVDDIFAA
jgi:Uma2 family endonuclease